MLEQASKRKREQQFVESTATVSGWRRSHINNSGLEEGVELDLVRCRCLPALSGMLAWVSLLKINYFYRESPKHLKSQFSLLKMFPRDTQSRCNCAFPPSTPPPVTEHTRERWAWERLTITSSCPSPLYCWKQLPVDASMGDLQADRASERRTLSPNIRGALWRALQCLPRRFTHFLLRGLTHGECDTWWVWCTVNGAVKAAQGEHMKVN